jgi:hypothetical protein
LNFTNRTLALAKQWALACGTLLLLNAGAVTAQSVITTIAGGGSGDGGPATSTPIVATRVALDAAGNLYVTDTNNARIRKVAPNGTVSTVAGTGFFGFSGDGGAATAASLALPTGIALDAAGNLYIADTLNNRIRKVNAAGVITTVAGSSREGFAGDGAAATSASLKEPRAIAVGAEGVLYIADTGNFRIRKVDANGVITTLAGTGTSGFSGDGGAAASASLSTVHGLTVDAAGNVFFADSDNHRIRKVSASGTITTVAGNGGIGYSGDGMPATAATLAAPYGVAIDSSGRLFIADASNYRVRLVSADGTIFTYAGTGIYGYSGDGAAATAASITVPTSVALDAAGNLYLADRDNNRVRRVDTTGVISTVAGNGTEAFSGDGSRATAANLNMPHGVAAGADGSIFIADTGNDRIRKVDAAGTITTVAGNGIQGASGDGGAATAAHLYFPAGIAQDAAGNLYIADQGNSRVRKVTADGVITTVAGNGIAGFSGDGGAATFAGLRSPSRVALDAAGRLYIADTGNHRIRRVEASGVIITVAGNGVAGFGGDGGSAQATSLNGPYGIGLDAAGNLYIADTGNNRIRKVDLGGVISTVAGTGTAGFGGDGTLAKSSMLSAPYGLAVGSGGILYIADQGNQRIRKVGADGLISTVAGNGIAGFGGDGGAATSARLSDPYTVALDAAGNLYIADTSNNRIRKVTAAGSPAGTARAERDFNGNGKSDISWIDPNGQAALWLMDGTSTSGMALVLGGGSNWKIANNRGDFNGDGKSDLLWTNSDGSSGIWLMDGTNAIGIGMLLGAGSGWSVIQVADFNGDGKSDLLWRHTDGSVAVWLMNGTSMVSGAVILGANTGWSVTHVADLDGDGKADLVWKHADGSVMAWLMNGLASSSTSTIFAAGSTWEVTHTGDFNGDGKKDLVWKDAAGSIGIWLMNGLNRIDSGVISSNPAFTVTHAGDFDGDGKSDLLLRGPAGQVVIWLMDGMNTKAAGTIFGGEGGWAVTHVADFNGDGKTDLLWKDAGGQVAIWTMSGLNPITGAVVFGGNGGWLVSP